MELWDVYDRNRNKTGEVIERGKDIINGELHLVVHVCIFNSNGEMLIQHRQSFKDGWPNLWDLSVGGSATQGDTSQTAAEREVLEEIGYKLDLSNTRPYLTINFNHGFDDVYFVEEDIDISTLKLQYEEVQAVKWVSKEEVLSMIDNGLFIPYHKSLIELFFDMKYRYGMIIE